MTEPRAVTSSDTLVGWRNSWNRYHKAKPYLNRSEYYAACSVNVKRRLAETYPLDAAQRWINMWQLQPCRKCFGGEHD